VSNKLPKKNGRLKSFEEGEVCGFQGDEGEGQNDEEAI
jgi:hypothetical protein